MGLLVVGDVHNQEKEPKKSQATKTLNYIFESKYNNPNNSILFLGDLVESIDTPHEVTKFYVNLFLNISKFKQIYILQGNHDASIISSLLQVFDPFQNVHIITKPEILDIENNRVLALPYYYEDEHNPSMQEKYGRILPLLEEYQQKFDFVFHHVEDETEHYTKKFCDLSWVKTNYWLCGHIHTCSLQKGGRYLGACILNSSSEKGRQPYIAFVQDREYELIEIPKFLDYYSVEYPNNLPSMNTELGLWTVTNSLDRNETITFYEKQALEKGFKFYPRRIFTANFEKFSSEDKQNVSYEEEPLTSQFEKYALKQKLNNNVQAICLSILSKRD